jgi:hypothetical protein
MRFKINVGPDATKKRGEYQQFFKEKEELEREIAECLRRYKKDNVCVFYEAGLMKASVA